MRRGLRWLVFLSSGAWMAAVCFGTARTADPQWALDAFRRVIPSTGIAQLSVYLAWAVVLPAIALWLLWFTLVRRLRHRILVGGLLGACLGVYLDYLQFAVPFAGDITNVPGLPTALVVYGDDRLAKIWACSFLVNVVVYAVAGMLLSWPVGERQRPETDGASGAVGGGTVVRPKPPRRVALGLVSFVGLFVAALWQTGPGFSGVNAFLAQFDAAPGIRYTRGIVYGRPGGADLKLDMARPDASTGPVPAVICIHGGGWHGGTRDEYVPLIVQLAQRGYVAVTVDYRLTPEHRFPAQLEDVKSAVQWLRANADQYGVNPQRIGAVGWSAGGYLACFLGTSGGSRSFASSADGAGVSDRVQAVVSFSGVTDLTVDYWSEISSGRRALLGVRFEENPEAHRTASPISYVDEDDPSFLFLHAVTDPVVPLDQSERLLSKIHAAGVEGALRKFTGLGHRWSGRPLRSADREAFEFLDRHLKRAAPRSINRRERRVEQPK